MRVALLFLVPVWIYAHSLSVTASYESNELFIESFFGNGVACKGCKFDVKIGNQELLKGTLDNNGVFEKEVKIQPPFTVGIDGGMGHWASVDIESDELEPESDIQNNTINNIDATVIRQIIKSELNKQNSKIESLIEKNKSNMEKMLVGLGYILGIFGLWQLFVRKKEK